MLYRSACNCDIYSESLLFLSSPGAERAFPTSLSVFPPALVCLGPGISARLRHQHQESGPAGQPGPSDLQDDVLKGLREEGLLVRVPVPAGGDGLSALVGGRGGERARSYLTPPLRECGQRSPVRFGWSGSQ